MQRRDFIAVGLVGGLGLSLVDVLRAEANAGKQPKAKSIIHIFLPGGLAHQETFDPKPLSPVAYRGDVRAIQTRLPGVQFSSHLPNVAKVANRLTLCRAVSHVLADHDAGVHQSFTGYAPSPVVAFPSMGSIISHQLGARGPLPGYICVPRKPNDFAGTGYLNSSHGPFGLGSDPGKSGYKVRDLRPPRQVKLRRINRGRKLLKLINRRLNRIGQSPELDSLDAFYQRAFQLMTSQRARDAFDLNKESPKTRAKYGANSAGSRMLVARRLIEAGSRCVTMTYGSWDDHFNISPSIKSQLPPFDQALAALIEDLHQRGLLKTTIVLVSSEFGRTPAVNKNAGRDHWAKAYTIALAGAGLKPGYVHGRTNLTAAEAEDGAVTVQDVFATIYELLGINWKRELMAPGARPIEIVKNGKLIREILC